MPKYIFVIGNFGSGIRPIKNSVQQWSGKKGLASKVHVMGNPRQIRGLSHVSDDGWSKMENFLDNKIFNTVKKDHTKILVGWKLIPHLDNLVKKYGNNAAFILARHENTEIADQVVNKSYGIFSKKNKNYPTLEEYKSLDSDLKQRIDKFISDNGLSWSYVSKPVIDDNFNLNITDEPGTRKLQVILLKGSEF
jgi:hypothetical protein